MNALSRWIGSLGAREEGRWSAKRSSEQPRVPDGKRAYVIGDIHGRKDLLDRLHTHIAKDIAAHPKKEPVLIYLGDYIDRGPDSQAVLETLSGDRAALPLALPPVTTIYLRGNHEQAMLDFMNGDPSAAAWLDFGGVQTLASYKVDITNRDDPDGMAALSQTLAVTLPAHHIRFLSSLKMFSILGDYLFVHAGIRPNVPPARQAVEDLLFIGQPFLSYQKPHPYMVVHGHHIVDEPDIQPNRIGIDTGAFATGRLTCLILDGPDRTVIST